MVTIKALITMLGLAVLHILISLNVHITITLAVMLFMINLVSFVMIPLLVSSVCHSLHKHIKVNLV